MNREWVNRTREGYLVEINSITIVEHTTCLELILILILQVDSSFKFKINFV